MIERLDLNTTDGETLEARWDSPEDPWGVVVFCHPHPLQGGTMMAPLMISVSTQMLERGLAVLRFNFRGTGSSTGKHEAGEGEQHDITAAVEEAQRRRLPMHLSGWSFGAGSALRWLGDQDEAIPYSGIAPEPSLLPDRLPPGPKRIVVGTRDQVISVTALRSYAEDMGIDLLLTPGDHFFHGRGKRVGDLVAQGFE